MALMPRNEALLDEFRGPGLCGYCGRWCQNRCPHHAFERGVNSWKRIDLRWNLMAMGFPCDRVCQCHQLYHNGRIKRGQILAKIAAREGLTVEWIIDEHCRLLLTGGKGGRSVNDS